MEMVDAHNTPARVNDIRILQSYISQIKDKLMFINSW